MPTWKLKNSRTSAAGSNWKPQGAGAPTFTCDFIDPQPDGNGAVSAGSDGTLRVKVEVAAAYERRRGTGIIAFQGRGITDTRITLRRGSRVWMQGAGWVRLDPVMALRHRSIPARNFDILEETFGTWSRIIEGEIDADLLGPGPVNVSIYLEGHQRELNWHPRHKWNPALAGTFGNVVTIDGESPDTFVDDIVVEDGSFYVIGRATDNHDVKQVLLTVTDEVTGQTLNRRGRWTERAEALEVPIQGSSGIWSWEFPSRASRGSGQYSVTAQAEDTAERGRTRGNKQGRSNLDLSPVRFDVDT